MKNLNFRPLRLLPLEKAGYILLLIFTFSAGFSCSNEKEGIGPIELAGRWKVIPRDLPEARDAGYNDSAAPEIPIPGTWTSLIPKNRDLTSTVWLRRHVHIDAALAGRPLVLSLGRIAVADEAYFNGVQVGGAGIIPEKNDPLGYGFAWQKSRHYLIPAQAVKYGGDNVIAIRVFSHVINGMAGAPRIAEFRAWSRTIAVDDLISMFVNQGALILNLILIILFLIALEWRSQAWYIVYSIILLPCAYDPVQL